MKLSSLAKYIDQPLVRAQLHDKMPATFVGCATAFTLGNAIFAKEEKRCQKNNNPALNTAIVVASTVAFTLLGARGLKIAGRQILKPNLPFTPLKEVKEGQKQLVENFFKENNPQDKTLKNILEKAKNSILSIKDIEYLTSNLKNKDFLDKIIGKNNEITSKEILGEINKLTLLGAYSVLGGITGGIIADKATQAKGKKRTVNKIKEGFYQFFANIFLCNVGAAMALYALEKSGKKVSPLKKMGAMIVGIVTTGIIGGSLIANYLSSKILDPSCKHRNAKCDFYERKPELLDIALHVDDIATAGVLSGVGWISAALPLFYAISGYRAGIGYRNHNQHWLSPHYAHHRAAQQFKFD